jgi:hypothetical protein
MTIDRKDLGTGAVFIAVALLYGGIAYRSLPIGEALDMGPGYFPLVLSALLAAIGAILVLRALVVGEAAPFFGLIAWRGMIAISLAALVFGLFLRQLGLLPAIFVTSFVCSLATQRTSLPTALALALFLSLFCTLVFSYGVRLPIPIIGTWFVG